MPALTGCSDNTDPLKLVREGTDQVRRDRGAPDPASVLVDEHRPEHAMVFAAAYASHLEFYDLDGNRKGDWAQFFSSDQAAGLAVAAIDDVATYRSTVSELLRALEDPPLPASAPAMITALGAMFDCLGTLAVRLDALQRRLPTDHSLRATVDNLIRSQLSPMLHSLIGYYRAGQTINVVDPNAAPPPDVLILGGPLVSFRELLTGAGLSDDWAAGIGAADWSTFISVDPTTYRSAYGPSAEPVDQINHLATHNLFTAICVAFLGVYARVVDDAADAVQASFEWNGHQPHYALFLAFLELFEHARDEVNSISAKHLDFYYRQVLQLKERSAQPPQAHVLVELAKHVSAHLVAEGALMKAGKDETGADARFAVDRELVANRAGVAQLESVYRHHGTDGELPLDDGRIYASPVANSDDGLGAKLSTPDRSWHPFANKVYAGGSLASIDMPPAEVGFAIASHLLWLAEGTRVITLAFDGAQLTTDDGQLTPDDLRCRLTVEKGWLEVPAVPLFLGKPSSPGRFPGGGGRRRVPVRLHVELAGDQPPITPYDAKVHGHSFDTGMPMLVVTLRHRPGVRWSYAALEQVELTAIHLDVDVTGLRSLALSNDHGPIDASKPFQAYGATPMANSALVIGSKEAFQKHPSTVTIRQKRMVMADAGTGTTLPTVDFEYLDKGTWQGLAPPASDVSSHEVNADNYEVTGLPAPEVTIPDLSPQVPYSTSSRDGFVRLKLSGDFGTGTYPLQLATWIKNGAIAASRPKVPVVPTLSALTLDYRAVQDIEPQVVPTEAGGRFFHITPFGHVEPVPRAGSTTFSVVPRFRVGSQPAEAELYIGVTDLAPPQNLTLLFQVVDGTANPLALKPEPHIDWSYLRGDEWVSFDANAIGDGTDGLLSSGVVTLSVPADATLAQSLLPAGLHWIRLAVASASDAVCRLVMVAAQALGATYVTREGETTSSTSVLPPGTITKLDPPDAAVKGVAQPFPTFGGRPAETPSTFATRVSERLRHKDRAIALWDYERLVLAAFPDIYQVRCLNHTRYEPGATPIYRELAPGHVTVVTIPDLAVPNPRDPLRPYTSLRVLGEIDRFLTARMSCFARLHVCNPQFENVRVELRVRLREGVDEAFHVDKLRNEITQFLSPWAFRGDARPTFNGKVHKSVLVNFLEERPYVDYVTDVALFHGDPTTGAEVACVEEVEGSRAISILVSAPPTEHRVDTIPSDEVLVAERCACGPRVD